MIRYKEIRTKTKEALDLAITTISIDVLKDSFTGVVSKFSQGGLLIARVYYGMKTCPVCPHELHQGPRGGRMKCRIVDCRCGKLISPPRQGKIQ